MTPAPSSAWPPRIPMLLGPSNLDHWNEMLWLTVRFYGLTEHFSPEIVYEDSDAPDEYDEAKEHKAMADLKRQCDLNSTEPEDVFRQLLSFRNGKWLRKEDLWNNLNLNDEVILLFMIKSTLTKIRPQLIAAGWDPDIYDDNDSYALDHYLFIMREVPKMTSVVEAPAAVSHTEADDIVDELCSIDVNDYGSLTDYQEKIKSLRRRLTRADIYFPDKMLINIAISGLSKASAYQAWAQELSDEVEAKRLNWVLLMAAMSIKATKELQNRMEE